MVNIPIIYFSVQWWNTLHQGASVSLHARADDGGDDVHRHDRMVLAFWAYSIAIALARAAVRDIAARDLGAAWALQRILRQRE